MRALGRLLAAVVGVLLAGVIAEAFLRVRFDHLSPRLRGFLSNCYDPGDDVNGIYYLDPRLGLTLPRPDFATTCTWNALTWHHQGDHDGFRNPKTPGTTDVALLGDSIVYGHGVEEPDTIAGCLRSRFGLTTANYGMTGASPVHYLAFARNYALRRHPKALVVVVFANDLRDISAERSADDIRAFDERRVGPEMQVLAPDTLAKFAPEPSLPDRLFQRSFFLRAFRFGLREWHAKVPAVTAIAPDRGASAASSLELERGSGPSVTYLKTAIQVLADDARRAQSLFVVAYVPAVQADFSTENRELPKLLSSLAERDGFLFVDSTPSLMLAPTLEKPHTRLVDDGHLSGTGACLVAGLVAQELHDVEHAPIGVPLSVASPLVRLTDFWDVETDERGSFAWTKAESTLEVSGLPSGIRLEVSLLVQHLGPSSWLAVTSADGERREVAVSAGTASVLPQSFRADEHGKLLIRLATHPFRPSDRGSSSDGRELGVALSAIELERGPS